MEALSGFMKAKHDFMDGKIKEGKVPDTPQLVKFLTEVCAGCGPLVAADGVADTVRPDLRKGFASVGWDVNTNKPDTACKTPPNPAAVLSFLKKAAIKFRPTAAPAKPPGVKPMTAAAAAVAPAKPTKLALEVSVPAEGEDEDGGLMFGTPAEPTSAPAAKEARDAKDARAAKLGPNSGTPGSTKGSTRNARFKVRIVDVPADADAAKLKGAFEAFGALDAELQAGGSTGGMGFVSFPTQEAMDKALAEGASLESGGASKKLTLSLVKAQGKGTSGSARGGGGRDGNRTPGGGQRTPGSAKGRGDSSEWRGGGGGGDPALARAKSEVTPKGKWDQPPADKCNADDGWAVVSKGGSKMPTGGGNGGKNPKGGPRSAPNTSTGRRDGGRGGGRGGKGGRGRGGKEEKLSKSDQWAKQQEETPEVESDDEEDVVEPVFDPGSWQLTLQGFWQTSGELGQVVGMGYHRHWTGKVNFTADGKFWMIKTDQKPDKKKKALVYWSADSGTSGRWERKGPKLLLYWFKWPAEKLKTKDGGQTFHSTQGYKFSIEYEQTLKEWHPAHMPKDFVPAGSTPKGRTKFIMPTVRCHPPPP